MKKLLLSFVILSSSIASAESLSVALDWVPNLNHIGLYVAQAKGFYKDAGLDVDILPYGSTSPSTLVATKKVDIGIAGTQSVISNQINSREPIISIGAIWSTNTAAFAVLKSSGIQRPRDLDGKIYAAYGGAYETPIIKTMIQRDGGKGEFKSPVLGVYGTDAMLSKRADFVWIFEGVQGVEAALQGTPLNTFALNDYGIPDYYTPLFVAHRDQLSQPKLRAFMKATQKGYEYAEQHPEEAAAFMIASTNKGTFPDPRVLIEGIKYMKNRGAFHEKGRKWGYQSLKKWTEYPKFLLDAGVLKRSNGQPVTRLNYAAFFTNELLK